MVISMHLNYCTKYILVVKNVPRIRPSKTRIKFVEMCKLNFRFFYRIGPTCDGQCKGKYTSGSKAKQVGSLFWSERDIWDLQRMQAVLHTLMSATLSLFFFLFLSRFLYFYLFISLSHSLFLLHHAHPLWVPNQFSNFLKSTSICSDLVLVELTLKQPKNVKIEIIVKEGTVSATE